MEELRVDDTAACNEKFRTNCETFEEILTAIGPVSTKPADRKTIMHELSYARSNEKKYHRLS